MAVTYDQAWLHVTEKYPDMVKEAGGTSLPRVLHYIAVELFMRQEDDPTVRDALDQLHNIGFLTPSYSKL